MCGAGELLKSGLRCAGAAANRIDIVPSDEPKPGRSLHERDVPAKRDSHVGRAAAGQAGEYSGAGVKESGDDSR